MNGKPVRESTGTAKETEARRFMKEREGRVATGQPILPRADRIRYDEVAEDRRRHYETTGERGLEEAGARLKDLAAFFGTRRVASIGPNDATAYALKRQGEQASNGTINRELAVLNRMLRLAYENGKLLRLPVIRKLKEAAGGGATGRLLRARAVRDGAPALPAGPPGRRHDRARVRRRTQREVLTLQCRQLDLEAGTLRLDASTTKNEDSRLRSTSRPN